MENEEFEENLEKLIFSEDNLEIQKKTEKRKGSFLEGFSIALAFHFAFFFVLLFLFKKVSDTCSFFFPFVGFFQIAYIIPLGNILFSLRAPRFNGRFWERYYYLSIGEESLKGYSFCFILTFCLSIITCLILFPAFFIKLFKQIK